MGGGGTIPNFNMLLLDLQNSSTWEQTEKTIQLQTWYTFQEKVEAGANSQEQRDMENHPQALDPDQRTSNIGSAGFQNV